jgi:hypothetical protein
MPQVYTRQSAFSNGDVIDAPLFNAEFDQIEQTFSSVVGHLHDGTVGGGAIIDYSSLSSTPVLDAANFTYDSRVMSGVLSGLEGNFDVSTGHKHDGTAGEGVPIPFIQKSTTGVYIDTTTPASPKINFRINGVVLYTSDADYFSDTTVLKHTPDGGTAGNLSTYLYGLEIAVGDAESDAAAASLSADRAESAAQTLGIPVYHADGSTATISNSAENADLVFEGDGTVVLPTTLVKGRRFTIRCSSKVSEKLVTIGNPNFSIIGNLAVISAGDDLTLSSKQLVILEAISTTELEII